MTLYLWLRFWAWSIWLPFVAAFAVLRGVLMVPVGDMGPFQPGIALFGLWGEGGGLVGFVQSCELSVHAWPSEVYPNGKLQWHFTCGFDFRYSLWLPSLFSWKYPSYLQLSTEAASDQCFLKNTPLKARQNTWKILVAMFIFDAIAD